MPNARRRTLRFPAPRTRRGMALLMVMIGVVVCTILTAGFLSSQGTSIGIARNERDASKCHAIAQTGVDMCYWLIRNKPDWRETMTPGSWLNGAAIGDGTVTVSVSDGAGNSAFSIDPTQAAIVTSTGTYDGRAFTLTASIRPTGGGTVFYNGNFVNGTISVGNNDLLTPATVDSYNSGLGAYNAGTAGSNANFASDSPVNNALTVYFPSVFKGSYAAAPTALLTNVLDLVGMLLGGGPSSTSNATENRTPGSVIEPNTTGLTYRNAFSYSNGGMPYTLSTPGRFDSFTVTGATVNIAASGIYYITGNMSVGSTPSAVLQISDGVSAVFVVDGNFTLDTGSVKLLGTTSQIALYVNGTFTQNKGAFNTSTSTGRATIFGTNNCTTINLTGTGTTYGSIYAPQAAVTMQTNSPKLYGAVIAKSLTMKNTSALHFDEALRNLKISNVTGGSAPAGTADYRMSIMGGPGVQR